MSPNWRLCDDQVMRNKVTFCIDQAFFATLISRLQYIELQVSRHLQARSDRSLPDICYTVQQTVVGTLKTVISKMKYKPYTKVDTQLFSNEQPFDLAFTCCLEDSHSDHLMKIVKDTSGQHAECLNSLIALNLKNEHFVWFNQVSICLYKSHWSCDVNAMYSICLLYTSPSPRDATLSRMPSSA